MGMASATMIALPGMRPLVAAGEWRGRYPNYCTAQSQYTIYPEG